MKISIRSLAKNLDIKYLEASILVKILEKKKVISRLGKEKPYLYEAPVKVLLDLSGRDRRC